MKTFFIVILTVILSSCTVTVSSKNNDKPSPSPTQSTEQRYVSDVRNHYAVFDDYPASKLVHLAHTTCDALGKGVTGTEIANLIVKNAPEEYQKPFGYAIGAGVRYYCPQYKDQIRR